MANVKTNPWSFTGSDVAAEPITAATGLTLNADGTVTITTTVGLTFISGLPEYGFVVTGATNSAYNGFYLRLTGASGATSFVMQPQFSIAAGTAQSGSGTLVQAQWRDNERIEDMSWQDQAAKGNRLIIYDRNGFLLWSATATDTGFQNRGKLFWVHGFAIAQIDAGTVLVTIN
jgi:hypothetical protein